MRWEDERWVKVYTRDTGEWLALGWEAQALFLFALRKADRAGILKTGKMRTRGLAGMTGMPLDVVERAAPLLLEDGCMRETDGGYIIPNFLSAQEASTSASQRKRDQRERDRAKALADGVPESTSGMLLDSMASMSRQEVTPGGHIMSSRQEVTGVTTHVTPARHAGTVTPRVDKTRVDESREDLFPEVAVASPVPAKTPKEPKKREPTGDPRHAPLVKALTDAGWPFDGPKDAAQVKALLALADQQEATRGDVAGVEVLRRARIAWSQFPSFHSARTLSGLRSKWGEFATPDEGRSQGPPDVRRGGVRAELMDHTKPQEPF